MTTSEITASAENEPLDATASQLAYLVESFLDLGVLVHDNQGTPQSHAALTRKTNQVVSQLSGLTNSPFTQQYPIPVDVLTYIEDGRNPDIYSREFVEVTAKSNARLKGKMLAFRKLLEVLGDKLVEEFPHLKAGVDNIQLRTIHQEPLL
ncbi:hypothetical protein METBIDRAFT_33400 [Metschnikowia bicuspidata var. bicuspidata NRRL YB-4993]|uniref:Mediator of RNA polymerase II transcription subunit 10 n=1 Tax=Metschnikowia bicuspidata var. bicuspidata NRRL YB-4993 TaxID=869754 RepID=A0A1A0H535_9ASCO|nr:hypothetical protein METBIDRAFT_33400 [Metschnikowia bicuspidata var. bicuspidata NRRL YB-4993]OBA19189.1 hypothetical protein METBIDRAFT_33400 [Metschnikowia bicuspidata var. bicuspidata NRRL YB-4993]